MATQLPRPRPGLFGRRSSIAGYSFIEVLMSIGILSISLAVCVPRLSVSKRQAIAAALVGDLRVFATAFETYAQEHGSFPAEANAGEMVPEMAGSLGQKGWLKPTPIGGQYNWDADQVHYGTRYRAVIQISATAAAPLIEDVELWEAIDKLIDDGNLNTGIFRLGAGNEPIYIIAQ